MLQERKQKKSQRPTGGNSPLSMGESVEAPEVDDVLAEIDSALDTADALERELRQETKGCHC
jgi:hypothetical protein